MKIWIFLKNFEPSEGHSSHYTIPLSNHVGLISNHESPLSQCHETLMSYFVQFVQYFKFAPLCNNDCNKSPDVHQLLPLFVKPEAALLCNKSFQHSGVHQVQHSLKIVLLQRFYYVMSKVKVPSSMVKLILAEITSFSWKLKLSQLNYFTGNFRNFLNSSCIFTKRRTLTPEFSYKFPKIFRTAILIKTRDGFF